MDEKKDVSTAECETMKEINFYKLKLDADRKRYMDAELNIFRLKLLKSKAMFVRDNIIKENEGLNDQFKEIHLNYVKSVKEATRALDLETAIREKLAKLSAQRNQLTKEYLNLQKSAKHNANKLREVKLMIMEQEKKNIALLRKLKGKSEDASIPENIRDKIHIILYSVNIKHEELYATSTLFYPI